MRTLIELRCEQSSSQKAHDAAQVCWTLIDAGPWGLAGQSIADGGMQQLEAVACELGWGKHRDGWVCPSCALSLNQQVPQSSDVRPFEGSFRRDA